MCIETLQKRADEIGIENNQYSIEQIKDKLKQANEEQSEIVENNIKYRNNELLDLYNRTIESNNEKTEKIRRKVLRKL